MNNISLFIVLYYELKILINLHTNILQNINKLYNRMKNEHKPDIEEDNQYKIKNNCIVLY